MNGGTLPCNHYIPFLPGSHTEVCQSRKQTRSFPETLVESDHKPWVKRLQIKSNKWRIVKLLKKFVIIGILVHFSVNSPFKPWMNKWSAISSDLRCFSDLVITRVLMMVRSHFAAIITWWPHWTNVSDGQFWDPNG